MNLSIRGLKILGVFVREMSTMYSNIINDNFEIFWGG